MRGEDNLLIVLSLSRVETPPHAWGRPTIIGKLGYYWRNTPTCVGKTLSQATGVYLVKKHPHMRGEDRGEIDVGDGELGNTPTCVGKT